MSKSGFQIVCYDQVGYTQANFYSRALLEMIYIRNVAFVTAVSMKWVLSRVSRNVRLTPIYHKCTRVAKPRLFAIAV